MEAHKNNIISFAGGNHGSWRVISMDTISGDSLLRVSNIAVIKNGIEKPKEIQWTLNAFISNLRYTTRPEKTDLDKSSRPLGQPEYNYAAMILIKKSDTWWMLTQDERRKIFEEDSKHIGISLEYMSFISRQLHHSRDLGEPFDFVTWFEFSSLHENKFNELLKKLRHTEEWKYVTREIDIRLENTVYTI
jgi:chlorite dismutase